jgi:cyclohexanone monooxygenase
LGKKVDYDAIIVGAGFAGLALIHHLKKLGISLKVFDKASGIGGTWNWNKYPGAATDSEGYYYCLSFSKEIMQEWTWSERYPGWEETNRYLHFVADKCNMWPDIQLNTEIISAEFNNDEKIWSVITNNGEKYSCKYFISAMGMISQPVIPNIKGRKQFKALASTHQDGLKKGLIIKERKLV